MIYQSIKHLVCLNVFEAHSARQTRTSFYRKILCSIFGGKRRQVVWKKRRETKILSEELQLNAALKTRVIQFLFYFLFCEAHGTAMKTKLIPVRPYLLTGRHVHQQKELLLLFPHPSSSALKAGCRSSKEHIENNAS